MFKLLTITQNHLPQCIIEAFNKRGILASNEKQGTMYNSKYLTGSSKENCSIPVFTFTQKCWWFHRWAI